MAKKTTKTETKKTEREAPKFGVNELVEETGLKPASIRVALRELEVEKEFGNQYGWNTKKDFDTVVKALKERSAKRIAQPKGDDEKPATKKRAARGKKAS